MTKRFIRWMLPLLVVLTLVIAFSIAALSVHAAHAVYWHP